MTDHVWKPAIPTFRGHVCSLPLRCTKFSRMARQVGYGFERLARTHVEFGRAPLRIEPNRGASAVAFRCSGATWFHHAGGRIDTAMVIRDPERNFEALWEAFHSRYPFFELRNVDWKRQYEIYRPEVTPVTSDDELFGIFRQMLAPLEDGHVELKANIGGKRRFFTAEPPPRFHREFSDREIKQLFEVTGKSLVAEGFGRPAPTEAWMLHYCRSRAFGYLRILELEGVRKVELTAALDQISTDFQGQDGFIIDIRGCPGGEDSVAIAIINRFCDRRRVAFHRKTKIGPGEDDFSPLQTWYLEPQGDAQFTGPIVLLSNDAVFSGGEAFALAIKQLPHVTIMGDRTNGIFSYTLDKKLPNGWKYCLSYQVYLSADMVCYEGKGVPADIEVFNTKADLETGIDPLIVRALELLQSNVAARRMA